MSRNDLRPLPLLCRDLGVDHFKVRNWMRFGLHGQKLRPTRRGARLYLRERDLRAYAKKHGAKLFKGEK